MLMYIQYLRQVVLVLPARYVPEVALRHRFYHFYIRLFYMPLSFRFLYLLVAVVMVAQLALRFDCYELEVVNLWCF